MITWMQRHKKYLIITIWVSTIAFVGAGFVGWGQYSYGDKAGAVAKVGEVEVTMGDLQKSYSRLYSQYAQMFQGNFDDEKAKQFGLKKQALNQLTQQALIINLAHKYSLKVTDEDLLNEIKKQDYFFKDGVFNKSIYKEVLSRNKLSIKDYEDDMRKQLLIQKTLKLFPTDVSENEKEIFYTLTNIADKISYKVLKPSDMPIDVDNENLKKYWEGVKQNFMSEVTYDIEYIKHPKISQSYDEKTINTYYEDNKNSLKDTDGKILSLKDAKDMIVTRLDEKATKKEALKTYIDYKKGKLDNNTTTTKTTISASNKIFSYDIIEKVSDLSYTSPYLKPVLNDGIYYTIKLLKVNSSKVKTFQEAKNEVLPMFEQEQKSKKLLELAKKSVDGFKGKTTKFITNTDAKQIDDLKEDEANEFLTQLFTQKQKRGFITLRSSKIVLYTILEQKLLSNSKDANNIADSVAKLKSGIFSEGLIKQLQQKYKTEIFIEGL